MFSFCDFCFPFWKFFSIVFFSVSLSLTLTYLSGSHLIFPCLWHLPIYQGRISYFLGFDTYLSIRFASHISLSLTLTYLSGSHLIFPCLWHLPIYQGRISYFLVFDTYLSIRVASHISLALTLTYLSGSHLIFPWLWHLPIYQGRISYWLCILILSVLFLLKIGSGTDWLLRVLASTTPDLSISCWFGMSFQLLRCSWEETNIL